MDVAYLRRRIEDMQPEPDSDRAEDWIDAVLKRIAECAQTSREIVAEDATLDDGTASETMRGAAAEMIDKLHHRLDKEVVRGAVTERLKGAAVDNIVTDLGEQLDELFDEAVDRARKELIEKIGKALELELLKDLRTEAADVFGVSPDEGWIDPDKVVMLSADLVEVVADAVLLDAADKVPSDRTLQHVHDVRTDLLGPLDWRVKNQLGLPKGA